MALTLVVTGNVINAADINQLVHVLARQSADTEVGAYWLQEGGYTTGAFAGYFVSSLSRVSVPVSVVVDTSIFAASNLGSLQTDHLGANGFHVSASSTAANANCNVAGIYTITY